MTAIVEADSGTIVEVRTVTLGDELASDHAIGATTLTVKDAVDFSDDGGTLKVGTEVIDYTAVDDDLGTLTLATATTAAYVEGDRVTLDPPAFEKVAQVMIGDFGEAVEATVPHTLWEKITDGIRPDGEGEVVTLDLVGTEFVVADVVGGSPVLTGALIRTDVPDLARVELGIDPGSPQTGSTDEVRFYGADGLVDPTGAIQATAFDQMLYYGNEHKFSSRLGTEEPYPTGRIWAAEGLRVDDELEVNGPITGIAWAAYTPTFTAATTNPTLANFTRTGRYVQVGKRVDFVIVITCNSTTGLGSGAYEFGLPVIARNADEVLGQGFQNGPNQPYIVRGISTTVVSAYLTDTRAGMSSANSGITTGTVVRLSGTYEAA